jgi:cytochrome P450
MFMGAHPEWKDKVRAEIESLLLAASDCSSPAGERASLASLSASLARIPLEAWESDTPMLDKVITETLRLAQPHTAMRRNLGPDILIDGKIIPSGAYLLYPLSDVHLDADLYPNPWKFDPSRPRPKAQYSWIGFGGGAFAICRSSKGE